VAVFAPVLAPQNPFDQDLNNSSLPPLGFSAETNETTSQMVDGEIQIVNETTNISATAAHPLARLGNSSLRSLTGQRAVGSETERRFRMQS